MSAERHRWMIPTRKKDGGGAKDDLRPEYDLQVLLKGGTWGKYVARYRAETNVVRLDPDVAQAFPDEEAVKCGSASCLECGGLTPLSRTAAFRRAPRRRRGDFRRR